MNRKIRKRLVAAGRALAPAEPPAPGGKPFFAWFAEDVLGLDSEEYRRAFWREAGRTGRSIGRTPRTFESWQRARGVHPAARAGEIGSNVKFKMENVKRPS